MEKFWMVMSREGRFCVEYKTHEKAKEVAENCARLNDEPFVVLEAMEVATPKQTPVEWTKL
jgi:hypothetical protein